MAIKTKVTVNGVSFDGATVRVATPRINGSKNGMSFAVHASIEGIEELLYSRDQDSPYDIDGENPFSQAYAYLKSLPEFADATDC